LAGTSGAGLAQAGLVIFVLAIAGLPALVVLATTLVILRREYRPIWPSLKQVRRGDARVVLSLGGNLFIIGIAGALAYQTDTLIVAGVLGAASAGIYAIALRMFGLVTNVLGAVMSPYWAAFSEASSLQHEDWLRSRFRLVMLGTVAASIVLAAAIVAFGPTLAEVWVGEALTPPRELLLDMAAWTVYAAAMSQASVLLNATGIVKPQAAMAIAMLAVNLPVSIGLTAMVGLPGPVLGSLFAHVVCAGVPTILLVRRAFSSGQAEQLRRASTT
jgi:O-antigen/teichoic acid export membrane protein